MTAAKKPHVVVVGGGWAGCAAAVTLVRAKVGVTLIERARVLGGRARRVTTDGITLDNGQHLLVGANWTALTLIAEVHGKKRASALFTRLPLTMRPFGEPSPESVAFTAWRLPAPLNLAGAILSARGLDWRERFALIDDFRRLARPGFQVPDGQTVAQCFAGTPLRAMASVWEPLCIAALNTPPENASARIFANVLRETFSGPARASDMLVPAADLTALFPEAAARWVTERGGAVRTGESVQELVPRPEGIDVETAAQTLHADAAIVAVGPHQLSATLGGSASREPWRDVVEEVEAFAFESITTVYLAHAERVPMPIPLMRLDDAPGQWIFDRGATPRDSLPNGARGLVAVVISASGANEAKDQAALANEVDAQLQRHFRTLPPLAWSRIIAEKRATYACTPGLKRPTARRIEPKVYLAGDYTDPDFPATLEAATRSGVSAARALLRDLRTARASGG